MTGYICSGPLLKSCEFSPDDVKEHFQRWVELGDVLIGNLGFPSKAELTPAQRCLMVPVIQTPTFCFDFFSAGCSIMSEWLNGKVLQYASALLTHWKVDHTSLVKCSTATPAFNQPTARNKHSAY